MRDNSILLFILVLVIIAMCNEKEKKDGDGEKADRYAQKILHTYFEIRQLENINAF